MYGPFWCRQDPAVQVDSLLGVFGILQRGVLTLFLSDLAYAGVGTGRPKLFPMQPLASRGTCKVSFASTFRSSLRGGDKALLCTGHMHFITFINMFRSLSIPFQHVLSTGWPHRHCLFLSHIASLQYCWIFINWRLIDKLSCALSCWSGSGGTGLPHGAHTFLHNLSWLFGGGLFTFLHTYICMLLSW